MEYLHRGLQEHCSGLEALAADPLYDELHGNPQFEELLAQVHLSH
jgi:hypothetical protein